MVGLAQPAVGTVIVGDTRNATARGEITPGAFGGRIAIGVSLAAARRLAAPRIAVVVRGTIGVAAAGVDRGAADRTAHAAAAHLVRLAALGTAAEYRPGIDAEAANAGTAVETVPVQQALTAAQHRRTAGEERGGQEPCGDEESARHQQEDHRGRPSAARGVGRQ